MINIHFLKQRLNPEQIKMLDEVLEKKENTLQCYKELRKRYSGVKSNIKRIEKKLIACMQQLPEETFIPKWVGWEVDKIENKYSGIEKAIKKYKQYQQVANKELEAIYFLKCTSPREFSEGIRTFSGWLSASNTCLFSAEDDIRITKRYFKNITDAFAAFARSIVMKKAFVLKQAREAALQSVEPQKEITN